MIRPAELTDLPKLMAYWTENGHRYRPPLPQKLLTEAYWKDRTKTALKELESDKAYRFYVFDPKELAIMGTIAFYKVRRSDFQDCTLGYTISGEYEGKRLMYESVSAAIKWVFEDRQLRRIEASHALDNPRSGRLLDRLGFKTVSIDYEKGRRVVELRKQPSRT